VQFRLGIGDPVAKRLLVRERRIEGLSFVEVGLRDVERAGGHPGVAHTVGQASRSQAHLCHLETPVLLAEGVFDRDPDVVVLDLGVADPAALDDPLAAEMGNVSDDVDPLGIGWNEDERTPFVGMGVEVRAGHHEEDVGLASARGPPLVTVDNPLVAVFGRSGLEHLRVRPATL